MNIVVCVKQVPDTAEMKIDPVTNNLVRDGVTNIMNPYDQYALETALQLKDELGAHVTVITMGPPHAESVLRDCLAVGADEAKLVSDRAFGGADTLATSAAMANTIKHFGIPDLILCGRQAIDGDTAQVAVLQTARLSHSEISGSRVICTSPKLIAAYPVLHRLREPRHPPYALSYFLYDCICYQITDSE